MDILLRDEPTASPLDVHVPRVTREAPMRQGWSWPMTRPAGLKTGHCIARVLEGCQGMRGCSEAVVTVETPVFTAGSPAQAVRRPRRFGTPKSASGIRTKRDCSYTSRVAQRRRDAPAHRLLVTVGLALLLGQTHDALWAQGSERSMFVSVLDSSGAPVEGLAPTDFVVEGGRNRARGAPRGARDGADAAGGARRHERVGGLRHHRPAERTRSIRLQVARGQRDCPGQLRRPPRILVESTGRIDRLRDGIGRIFAFSDTAAYLLDALVDTARGFERRAASRPVIVVVTTEGIDYSHYDSRHVLDTLKRMGWRPM